MLKALILAATMFGLGKADPNPLSLAAFVQGWTVDAGSRSCPSILDGWCVGAVLLLLSEAVLSNGI